MTDNRPICFFIMPFNSESDFFYEYLKEHIEKNQLIRCERADQSGGQGTFLDKIISHIKKSDVIIADCSCGNPNVMFELGIAYNENKDIIYITRDRSDNFPSDIKHFDFINYGTNKPKAFLEIVEDALTRVLSGRYESLYSKAIELQKQFNGSTGLNTIANTKEKFIELIESAKEIQRIPNFDETNALNQFLLPRIIRDSEDMVIMNHIVKWESQK
jgi:hypothetical protein